MEWWKRNPTIEMLFDSFHESFKRSDLVSNVEDVKIVHDYHIMKKTGPKANVEHSTTNYFCAVYFKNNPIEEPCSLENYDKKLEALWKNNKKTIQNKFYLFDVTCMIKMYELVNPEESSKRLHYYKVIFNEASALMKSGKLQDSVRPQIVDVLMDYVVWMKNEFNLDLAQLAKEKDIFKVFDHITEDLDAEPNELSYMMGSKASFYWMSEDFEKAVLALKSKLSMDKKATYKYNQKEVTEVFDRVLLAKALVKINDHETAFKILDEVSKTKIKGKNFHVSTFAAVAMSFYEMGMIHFELQEYSKALEKFQQFAQNWHLATNRIKVPRTVWNGDFYFPLFHEKHLLSEFLAKGSDLQGECRMKMKEISQARQSAANQKEYKPKEKKKSKKKKGRF